MGGFFISFFLQKKVDLQSYRGSRSELSALCGLRKQVPEAKEGPLEFRKEKGDGRMPRRGEGGDREGGEPEFAVMLPWLLTLDMKMKGFKINTINRETDFSEPVNLPSGGAVLPPLQPQPPSLVIALPIEFLEAVNTAP